MNKESREYIPGFIVISLIIIFAVVIGMLLTRPMPLTEAAGTLLTALVGMLSTKISTIVDYYFGSNKNSKEKDATILAQAQTTTAMTATTNGKPSGQPSVNVIVPPTNP